MPGPVRTDPLYDQIYEILWEKILAQEMAAGAHLRDAEWAEKLQVSRTPVREALRKLQKDGVLEPTGNGRYVLKRITSSELRNLYRLRAVLEAFAIRDLDGISSREIAKLTALVRETDECIRAHDFGTAFELNTEFHVRLTKRNDNAYLQLLIENIRRLILYARSSLRTVIAQSGSLSASYADHLLRAQDHHKAILNALKTNDFERAGMLMEQHLFETAEDMGAIFSEAGTVAGNRKRLPGPSIAK